MAWLKHGKWIMEIYPFWWDWKNGSSYSGIPKTMGTYKFHSEWIPYNGYI
jgi:hypothetical protein